MIKVAWTLALRHSAVAGLVSVDHEKHAEASSRSQSWGLSGCSCPRSPGDVRGMRASAPQPRRGEDDEAEGVAAMGAPFVATVRPALPRERLSPALGITMPALTLGRLTRAGTLGPLRGLSS